MKTFFNAQDKNDKHEIGPHDGIGDDQHRETDKLRRWKDGNHKTSYLLAIKVSIVVTYEIKVNIIHVYLCHH